MSGYLQRRQGFPCRCCCFAQVSRPRSSTFPPPAAATQRERTSTSTETNPQWPKACLYMSTATVQNLPARQGFYALPLSGFHFTVLSRGAGSSPVGHLCAPGPDRACPQIKTAAPSALFPSHNPKGFKRTPLLQDDQTLTCEAEFPLPLRV